jgi:predicted PurR-regulated permease PerM
VPAPDQPDDALEETVREQVDEAVEKQVEKQVEDRVEEAVAEAGHEADRAEAAAEGAEQSRVGAAEAGAAAVAAARVVSPDDPLLDTAAQRIHAQATEENPFGVPGRPMSVRSPFRIAFTASLGVALAYGLVHALAAVRSVLVLLLVSAFLAIGLNPAVGFLERHGLRRGRAVGVVFLGVLTFFVLFGLAVVPPIIDQASEFADQAPAYLQDLRGNRTVADLDSRYHFLDRAQDVFTRPEQVGAAVFGGVVGVGKVVFSAFFSTLTVLILTLYFLANLPSIKDMAYRLVPRTRRPRVGLLTDEILTRVGGYVGGALVIAGIAGVTTFLLLLVLGVPYPLALAMLVAVTDLVPLVGATIGAVVVTAVGLFVSVPVGIGVGVWYLAYQQAENYVLYPRIMKRSVDVSPAATVVAVLIGGSLLGVLGALLAIPIAAAIQLVLLEVVAPRQDAA